MRVLHQGLEKREDERGLIRDELIKDMDAMEDGMIRTGQRTDIWQDRLVWALCKAVYDIIKYLMLKEAKE